MPTWCWRPMSIRPASSRSRASAAKRWRPACARAAIAMSSTSQRPERAGERCGAARGARGSRRLPRRRQHHLLGASSAGRAAGDLRQIRTWGMRAAMAHVEPRLIDRLPKVRGRLTEGSLLSAVTWFRVGGPAECCSSRRIVADLAQFLEAEAGRRAGDGDRRRLQPAGARRRHRGRGRPPRPRLHRHPRHRQRRSKPAPARSTSTSLCRARRGHRRPRVPVRHSGHHRRRAAHERRRL